MNKKPILALASLSLLAGGMTGCSIGGGSNTQIDQSKTQIYVSNYAGGYGSEWLAAVKTRFEEAHKDDVIEEGKKGVQIVIDNIANTADAELSKILDNKNEVYFTEQSSYFTLKSQGILGDITDVVSSTLPGESSTILDKMTDEQKSFYGISENGETHYYALPHYSGFFGITYNIDLFDEKGFYFADKATSDRLADQFITTRNSKKSAGPDGEYNTSDDGLPTTYEEYFKLCDYIAQKGCTPFLSNGHNYKDYLNWLVNALTTTYEGKDEMSMVYSLSGTTKTLATIENGALKMDETPTTLSTENGYETARMAGKYHALKFMETLFGNTKYHNSKITNSGYSHTDAQTDFLYAGNDGVTDSIAMLSDGIWWENEAKSTFEAMAQAKGDSFSRLNRHFGFMPLPQATEAKAAEHKSTLHDVLFSFCFMKSNVEESKKSIVKEFIKFCNTDVSLSEYTYTTNTPKALKYTMSETDLAKMSPFGRSVYELKNKSDIVYPCSSSSFYANNQSKFAPRNQYSTKDASGAEITYCVEAIAEKGQSAETVFEGLYRYYKDKWSSYNK